MVFYSIQYEVDENIGMVSLKVYYVPFAANLKCYRTLQELWILSCMSYLWNLNVSSVHIFKLCKETRLLASLYCQTLLSDWLAFFSSLVITYRYMKRVVKGTWAFVYINNPLLVMAKIKLIESLRSIKRMTIRYNCLKIRLLLLGSIALKSIWQLIVVIFPLEDIFKPHLFREVLN